MNQTTIINKINDLRYDGLKQGEVLLGEAYHEDSNAPQNNWKGVIGATENKPVQ